MSAHLRRQIREAIGAALVGLPTTGANVFQSRVYPLETNNLPGLLVRGDAESVLPQTMGLPRTVQRIYTVEVEAVAKAVADLDDVLDGICQEVEVALAMPVQQLVGIATEITLTQVQIELTGTSDQPTGSATMSYDVTYFAKENAPDAAL